MLKTSNAPDAEPITEEWRGVSPVHEVSNLGRVRRIGSRVIFVGSVKWDGYRRVDLQFGEYRKTVKIAKLVAVAFLGDRPPGNQINHKNGVKTDDRAANLEYVTPKDNVRHAQRAGLRGNGHHMKLSPMVRRVISRLKGHLSCTSVGALFGITPSYVSQIQQPRWRTTRGI